MIGLIKKIYEHIYSHYSGNREYETPDTEKNNNYIKSFYNKLRSIYEGSIDERFIFEFIIYQIRQYSDKQTRFGKRHIKLNWILGKKAIERWQNKPEKWTYFNNQFIKKYNIPYICTDKPIDVDIFKSNLYAKQERNRFLNQEIGFIHCGELNLFDRFSKECIICKFKNLCSKNKL